MAHIDNLIDSVRDPELRAALKAEYDKTTKTRSLGLVFDRHQPESLLLPRLRPRVGDRVSVMMPGTRDRTQTDQTGLWTVANLERDSNFAILHDADGEVRREPLSRVVVIREFGDPIYPGLVSTGSVLRGGGQDGASAGKPFHSVINSENYHALEALLYPFEGQIDAIYIDPPYNSGARDWKYNNNYVDSNDPYRHSKWLSFMDRRLRVAKRLLRRDESVLICAIDENEVHRLTLLLGQIFPTSKIQMVSVLINPAGASIVDQFTRVDEQLLFVHIGGARPARTRTDTTPGVSTLADAEGKAKTFRWEVLQRSGGNSRRQDTKAKFFPIYVDEDSKRIVGCGDHLAEGLPRSAAPAPPRGCFEVWPIKSDGSEACWQVSDKTFRKYLNEGRIRLGRKDKRTGRWGFSFLTSGHMRAIEQGELAVVGTDEHGTLVVETVENVRRSQIGKTIWTNPAYSATTHGSIMLNSFIPSRKFPYPKSLYAVEDALRYYLVDKPNALVLDFFGGSGTTLHAVARLNHQDFGSRRSIIVTNNEVSPGEAKDLRARGYVPGDKEWEAQGICEQITKPRITSALTGYTPNGEPVTGNYRFVDEFPFSDGFSENVEFFDLTYEDPALVSLGRRFEAIAPMLWLKAGAQGRRISEIESNGWSAPDDASYGILFDTAKWSDFVQALSARPADAFQLRQIFIVTDSASEYQQISARCPRGVATSRLYADYLRTFEINTSRRH